MLSFVRNRWKRILAMALCGLFLFFIGSGYVIGRQVREAVSAAQVVSPGDPVSALLAVLSSDDISLAEKNKAVWVLGQLGDPQATETLVSLFTGGICDHSRHLCQRELGKAIQLCRGGQNIGAIVWRHGDLASP